MVSSIAIPSIMEVGKHASANLPKVLHSLGATKPLIITDKMMVKLGYIQNIQNILSEAGFSSEVFADTIPEPTSSSILAGVQFSQSQAFDAIIAVGGGSPIDSAKAISILSTHGGKIRDYKFPNLTNQAGIPVIAVPTTAGTGSEVTRFTIITDDENNEKMLCAGLGFMPKAAIIDYSLTLSLPPRTTADTGIDALTHAIEAYVSKKANLYSDSQAIAAMKLIGPNLRTVYHQPEHEQAREAMMLGSTLAGAAFSNASVALVHGMSRPIGAFFHVPHGLSNAMLLPMITEFSIPAAPERYADCARAIGIASEQDETDLANQKLVQFLQDLNLELNVPTLAEFGASQTEFDQIIHTMAEQAKASGSPDNNPRVPSIDEMVGLYQKLWN